MHVCEVSRGAKSIEAGSGMVGTRDRGEKSKELSEDGASVLQMKVLWDNVNVSYCCTTHFKMVKMVNFMLCVFYHSF